MESRYTEMRLASLQAQMQCNALSAWGEQTRLRTGMSAAITQEFERLRARIVALESESAALRQANAALNASSDRVERSATAEPDAAPASDSPWPNKLALVADPPALAAPAPTPAPAAPAPTQAPAAPAPTQAPAAPAPTPAPAAPAPTRARSPSFIAFGLPFYTREGGSLR